MGKTYTLASHNEKNNRPMWEFTTDGESVDRWTTLVTLVDRPEAQSLEALDGLSESVMNFYKQHAGQILKAQTLKEASGKPFNYLMVSFELPEAHQFEFNFVKIAMGPSHAYTALYAVRISDPVDYLSKGKKFLNDHSAEIGQAVGETPFPPLSTLPRTEF